MEESDPPIATGRGFGGERVEQQVGKILSSDPHWIGGGFLLQCLLLLLRSIHLSLLANQLATSVLPLLLLLLLS